MTSNLMFWLYAYVLTIAALIIAFQGVAKIRQGDEIGHAKKMNLAILVILGFVASYVLKVIFLGREPKTNWESIHFTVLYAHEFFIAGMLIAGGYARYLAGKYKHTLGKKDLSDQDIALRKRHRLSGKICLASTTMALFTATFVLHTIYKYG